MFLQRPVQRARGAPLVALGEAACATKEDRRLELSITLVSGHSATVGFRCPIDNQIGEKMRLGLRRSCPMIVVDAGLLAGVAALITSVSTLVWAVRRKP